LADYRATINCYVDSYYTAGDTVSATGEKAVKLEACGYFEKLKGKAEPKEKVVESGPKRQIKVK